MSSPVKLAGAAKEQNQPPIDDLAVARREWTAALPGVVPESNRSWFRARIERRRSADPNDRHARWRRARSKGQRSYPVAHLDMFFLSAARTYTSLGHHVRRHDPKTSSATKPAPTCSSTRTTRSTGAPGARPRSPRPRRADKPILLSVGYAACHWCHVMAHESFEDAATAAVMNRLFVNIKVDREERPDVDQIYMAALHALGEQGGWPLTMFLTPEGEPIWGGTYFPKTARYGRPAFVSTSSRRSPASSATSPPRSQTNRAHFIDRLTRHARPATASPSIARSSTAPPSASSATWTRQHGGTRGAPKFPQASLLELLWRAGLAHRQPALPRDRAPHASRHRRRRHLRPHRRRLRALLGRRPLARAAFREDALRQCPARRAADLRLRCHRRPLCSAAESRKRSPGFNAR